jgi:dTDP-4-dehydrorhamnose 3,5-epimerase
MRVTELELSGVKILEPRYFEDFRGYYCETYSSRTSLEIGIDTVFKQDNHSLSLRKNTLRGIHFQLNPKAQIKLVRCVRGQVMDYVVDLRRDSPSFKKWARVELSEGNRKQIWIPAGFGHGFITLTDNCEVLYKVDEWYYPVYDRAIAWVDPEIAIDWGVSAPIISEKDKKAPRLRESDVNFSLKENGV